MIAKYEKLADAFQGNAYPAMVDELASHLGISADSARRLGVGWAPIVPFKKGLNFDGWWVIPERDSDAKTIGLSLRSQDDAKVMYPGSQHGLIYAVNPTHNKGEHGYSAGPHNWARTMDAGVQCPVCEKPDGCLVSSDEPANPKAAICIREESGHPLKFGYLHILKKEGIVRTASALPGGIDDVVLIVEGFSDAAVALDLGFVGVGRPNNLACMDMLRDLVRGRNCVVVGENDQKASGHWPGRDGMLAAFQALRGACRVRMMLPPTTVKDLRAWKHKHSLDHDEFVRYIEKHAESEAGNNILDDDRPLTIARAYLGQTCKLANRYTLRRWEQVWYKYTGSRYSALTDEVFKQPIYGWAHDKSCSVGEKVKPLRADNTLLANLTNALAAEALVVSPSVPCWINDATGPEPKDMIVFENGVLDVNAYFNGAQDALLDSTPDLFTTAASPYAFDPTATCPQWLAFLESSLGDEPSKIDLLQEWMGYCLTPDTKHQKMMYMRGVTGSGKGRIIEVMSLIAGVEQTSSPAFTDLSDGFSKSMLLGKLICVVPDARASSHKDSARGLEILLNVTGNDAVAVNRKYKDPLPHVKLNCRLTIASNDMLDIPDNAGALTRRFNFIEFNRSFKDNPDTDLPDKLAREVQGIIVWALEGLRRLRTTNKFTVPASSKTALLEWETGNNPVRMFVHLLLDEGNPEYEVSKKELYDAWLAWGSERRTAPVQAYQFFERIKMACPATVSVTVERSGQPVNMLRGLRLKPWAAKQYLGRP